MKNTVVLPLSFLLCMYLLPTSAQNTHLDAPGTAGAYFLEQNDADNPCITAKEYDLIELRCANNAKLLGLPATKSDNLLTTSLHWPLQSANGLNDCNYYAISAYVDQNTSTGAVSDYNCGTKTYDGHRGTDISIWPFPFYKMDHDQVEVIAAAAGTIIDKSEGNFDKNCGSNNLTANYLVIQHADGSRVLYFHMKKNSLTTKAIGEPVAVGEYLAVVGSSGNSSGPHLHFEVWSGSTVSTRIDPFSGACNSLNPVSWWAIQKPYASAEILKTSVHTTDAILPACPATETPNESTCFSLPFQGSGLPPGAAKFYIFMRYETAGLTANLSILNPDSTVFSSWTYTSTGNFNASLKSWTKTLPTQSGTYTFQSSYNGIVCSKKFDIISATITPNGPTTFCQGDAVTLSANAANTYLWSTGATTQSIAIATSGNYTVTITNVNGCTATSSATSVTVIPAPTTPTITAAGSTVFCQGNSVLLSANAANAYLWSNGATTQDITVSISGNYTVTITNANGCTASSTSTMVMVNPLPTEPIIDANDNLLSSSASTGNQWYLNGSLIPGATSQYYAATQSGSYTVLVTNVDGCSATSEIFNFINTGIESVEKSNPLLLIPNPNNGLFTLEINTESVQIPEGQIEIFNLTGVKIWGADIRQKTTVIDIATQPAGIYFVCVGFAGRKKAMKVLKF